jgi:TRAP transporter TAXI family solute receptor
LLRIVIAALLVVLGCDRGPEVVTLRDELQHRLDDGFEDGVFRVSSFDRIGSGPFREPESGASGVFIYYVADLELLRDYSLTSWQGLNLGTLAFVVGATRSGIEGFTPNNSAGDVLRVQGRLSYQWVDGAWRIHDEATPPERESVARTAPVGSGPRAVMRSVRGLIERKAEVQRGTLDEAIVHELRRAVSEIDLRIAQSEGRLTLGTGPAPGMYHEFGSAFARYATELGFSVSSFATQGSDENGERIQVGDFDFGLIQSDVAEVHYMGWAEQDQIARRSLRAMASLWPEAVHVVTIEGTGIEAFQDLRGKRVAVGHDDSGSRFNAIRIGRVAGFDAVDFESIYELPLAESIARLESGELDAFFATEGFPAPALQALAKRRRDVRFLSIDAEVVATLSKAYFAYYPLTLPARTYPGQTEPVHTLGTTAVLATHRDTPDEAVERMLDLVLDSADALSRSYYRAGFISQETMRLGIDVPLHPAAEAFYAKREQEKAETEAREEEPPEAAPAEP